MNDFLLDLRFALRTLVRRPGFTLAILATLALGIGANTAIFTILNGVVLQPLPFPDSERVVLLSETNPRVGSATVASPPNVEDWSRLSDTVQTFGVARSWPFIVGTAEGSGSASGGIATPGWFQVHAVQPQLGRLLEPGDMEQGANHVAVLSHAYWQRQYGGDRDVIGRQTTVDGSPYRIIGVLPADAWLYQFSWVEMWTPLNAVSENTDNRDWRGFSAVGRMADGASVAQVRSEMESIRTSLEEQYPASNRGWGIQVQLLRDRVAGPVSTTLWIFLAAVGLVLLIGCVNVANLLLVRATDRSQEFAVRASLGAGRGRLIRHLLTESFTISAIGGILGFLLALWATDVLLAMAPPGGIPRLAEIHLDGRVLLFTILVSVVTAALFGLAPALEAARTDLNDTLRSARTGSGRNKRLRDVLVVAETALAFTLLIGAGLATRGFAGLMGWQPGFERENLLSVWALAPVGKYPSGDAISTLWEQTEAALAEIPGVQAVGMASAAPLLGGDGASELTVEGYAAMRAEEVPSARWFDVGPDYFKAMGIPLLEGREVDSTDRRESTPVAIVNETFRKRYLPKEGALGSRVTMFEQTMEVVGVVADVPPMMGEQRVPAEIYWPKRQAERGATYYFIRTQTAPDAAGLAALERQVRDRGATVEPEMQLSGLVPYLEVQDRQLVSPRFNMLLVDLFALMALVLAAIGIYGVVAYSVASRTREIAIHIAVGARPTGIMRTIVREGMQRTAVGLGIGLVASIALGGVLRGFLYGLPPTDPVTYLAVTALFAVVALVAALLPARRVTSVDPMEVLRTD